jgi:CRP-like cAMP-binding protein
VHLVACLWYYTAKIDEFEPDTWIVRYGFQDKEISTIYITCLYWAFTTLSTVGYGDISAYTPLEKILSITWMISCLYFLAFTIGSLSSFLENSHTKTKNLADKLAAIDEFVEEAKLNKRMARKIRFALKYSAEVSGFPWMMKQHIFNELPKKLKHEVSLAMHHGAARRLLFFKDKDSAVVSSIVPFLTPLCFKIKEPVYRQNDYADEIYFIVRGWVDYVYNDSNVISSIYRNDYFGDIEVIFQVNRKYSALVKSNLELLVMNRKLVNNLKSEYLSLWEEMKKVALTRDKKNKIEQSKMIRSSHRFIQKSLILHDARPVNPTLDDLSEQVKFLYEFAENISKKFQKLKNLITKLKSSKVSRSDSELY